MLTGPLLCDQPEQIDNNQGSIKISCGMRNLPWWPDESWTSRNAPNGDLKGPHHEQPIRKNDTSRTRNCRNQTARQRSFGTRRTAGIRIQRFTFRPLPPCKEPPMHSTAKLRPARMTAVSRIWLFNRRAACVTHINTYIHIQQSRCWRTNSGSQANHYRTLQLLNVLRTFMAQLHVSCLKFTSRHCADRYIIHGLVPSPALRA